MSRASLAASRADSSSVLASSACSRASSAAASAASSRPAARSAAFSARSSSRSRERRSARASRSSVSSRPRRSCSSRRRSSAARRSASSSFDFGFAARLGAPGRRRGRHVRPRHQAPCPAALGVGDHPAAVERAADLLVGGGGLQRGPQALERRLARLAPARLELLGGRDQLVDRRALGGRGVAQRRRALAGDGGLLRLAQIVDGVEQRVDQVAVLAHQRVGRPGGLGRLGQLADHLRRVALLRLAQLAGGRVALARELLERQAVEPAGDLLDRVSHLRPARRP